MDSGLGFAYILLGLVLGFGMGGMFIWSRNTRRLHDLVTEEIHKLRDRTIADTQAEVSKSLRLEMEPTVRGELAEKLEKEVRADAEKAAKRLVDDAETTAASRVKQAELESKNILLEARNKADAELKEARQELDKVEQRSTQRDSHLDARDEKLDRRESEIEARLRKHDLVGRARRSGVKDRGTRVCDSG
ncbi:MAG: Rnase Y domain-containing protein [bacterium]